MCLGQEDEADLRKAIRENPNDDVLLQEFLQVLVEFTLDHGCSRCERVGLVCELGKLLEFDPVPKSSVR